MTMCPKCKKMDMFRNKSCVYLKRIDGAISRHKKCISCGYEDFTIEISKHEYECQHKLLLQLQGAIKEYIETTKKVSTKQVIGASHITQIED